jgi:TonB family protein
MTRHLMAAFLLLVTLTLVAASQDATPQRVLVSQGIMSGQILTKVAPVYPPLAKQARIQGTVLLQVDINTSGDVVNIQLVSGHPMLAPAAIEAVKQWKYTPYLLNGEPVNVETQVVVNFTLAGKAPAEGVAGDAAGGAPSGVQGGVLGSVLSSTPGVATPGHVHVSSNVSQGLLITKVAPEYPADAREQRIQGQVRLEVTIDKEGNVSNIQLVSGHPSLAPAAIEAVKQWKYRPYLLNGEPVEVETIVTVNFTLAS